MKKDPSPSLLRDALRRAGLLLKEVLDILPENFEDLKSRHLFTLSNGEPDTLCAKAGYPEIWRGSGAVLYVIEKQK